MAGRVPRVLGLLRRPIEGLASVGGAGSVHGLLLAGLQPLCLVSG